MPQAPVYSASKAGVIQFVRSAGSTLARRGIRLLAVGPEFVDTPLVRAPWHLPAPPHDASLPHCVADLLRVRRGRWATRRAAGDARVWATAGRAPARVCVQVRQVMRDDPETARRLLGSLDIKLLPPQAVSDLLLHLIKNPTEDKVSVRPA